MTKVSPVRRVVPIAALVALAGCGIDAAAPPAAESVSATPPASAMPATAWAPQTPYGEARLSPFDPVR